MVESYGCGKREAGNSESDSPVPQILYLRPRVILAMNKSIRQNFARLEADPNKTYREFGEQNRGSVRRRSAVLTGKNSKCKKLNDFFCLRAYLYCFNVSLNRKMKQGRFRSNRKNIQCTLLNFPVVPEYSSYVMICQVFKMATIFAHNSPVSCTSRPTSKGVLWRNVKQTL